MSSTRADVIPSYVLPVIVLAQFAGTSLWFAGNAVTGELVRELGLASDLTGYITMSVQGGFILGTLLFAVASIADRFSPVMVFLLCSLLGAASNLLLIPAESLMAVLSSRFLTGFFLAGIYPVGMKIASVWYRQGLGMALGFLVGALVVGTAFPHLIAFAGQGLPWRVVIIGTSVIAATGGLILYSFLRNGPPWSVPPSRYGFDPGAVVRLFRERNFRRAAIGYFGHMWELYAFWAFVPVMIGFNLDGSDGVSTGGMVSLLSFVVIAAGGLSCIAGGIIAMKRSSRLVALIALSASGLSCLTYPVLAGASTIVFILFLIIWGMMVIPDSPQFSAMVAASSDPRFVATGLTIVNSIGFAITIVSIQLLSMLWTHYQTPVVFMVLFIGPLIGVWSTFGYQKSAE